MLSKKNISELKSKKNPSILIITNNCNEKIEHKIVVDVYSSMGMGSAYGYTYQYFDEKFIETLNMINPIVDLSHEPVNFLFNSINQDFIDYGSADVIIIYKIHNICKNCVDQISISLEKHNATFIVVSPYFLYTEHQFDYIINMCNNENECKKLSDQIEQNNLPSEIINLKLYLNSECDSESNSESNSDSIRSDTTTDISNEKISKYNKKYYQQLADCSSNCSENSHDMTNLRKSNKSNRCNRYGYIDKTNIFKRNPSKKYNYGKCNECTESESYDSDSCVNIFKHKSSKKSRFGKCNECTESLAYTTDSCTDSYSDSCTDSCTDSHTDSCIDSCTNSRADFYNHAQLKSSSNAELYYKNNNYFISANIDLRNCDLEIIDRLMSHIEKMRKYDRNNK